MTEITLFNLIERVIIITAAATTIWTCVVSVWWGHQHLDTVRCIEIENFVLREYLSDSLNNEVDEITLLISKARGDAVLQNMIVLKVIQRKKERT